MTEHSSLPTDHTATLSAHHDSNAKKIAIIGGGLTGLFTATLLERAFNKKAELQMDKSIANAALHTQLPQITIFEKSRSVGRLATRYRTNKNSNTNANKQWQWAFGAQFFTAKSDSFSQFIQPWLETGLLQPWCAQVVELTPANTSAQPPNIKQKEQWNTVQARYISTPKMTSWGRALADNLNLTTVQFKTRVAPLTNAQMNTSQNLPTNKKTKNKQTELFDENGTSLGCFDWVICTVPNGQAVDLMMNSSFAEQAQIFQPKMQACYTLMLGWDDIAALPETLKDKAQPAWDVAYMQDSILGRIFVEHHKPAHGDLLPSITIHARNDWSEDHVDNELESIQAQLLAAAQQALNWSADTVPSQIDCHRWRYAATALEKSDQEDKELGILIDSNQQWIVSGDWCGQGNIESCYRMAVETVEAITENSNE